MFPQRLQKVVHEIKQVFNTWLPWRKCSWITQKTFFWCLRSNWLSGNYVWSEAKGSLGWNVYKDEKMQWITVHVEESTQNRCTEIFAMCYSGPARITYNVQNSRFATNKAVEVKICAFSVKSVMLKVPFLCRIGRKFSVFITSTMEELFLFDQKVGMTKQGFKKSWNLNYSHIFVFIAQWFH